MSYPVFGKVKTIVLPTDLDSAVTLDEYKNLFGIDLKELIYLDKLNHCILFKAPNTMFLLGMHGLESYYGLYGNYLAPANSVYVSSWDEGVTPALTLLWTAHNDSEGAGLTLTIDSSAPFSIDSVRIGISEA